MTKIQQLIQSVRKARMDYLDQIAKVSDKQAEAKPSSESWSCIEITEHLYWAEHGALLGMWKTLHAIRAGKIDQVFESKHQNLPIEEIVRLTWQPKEKVPAVAAPRMGGSLVFWASALESLQVILEKFGNDLQPDELRIQAHPHPISGPMDFHQRLEFLAFHIRRHHNQVADVLQFTK